MQKNIVLDHGFVSLVDSMGTDKSIINSARVSYKGLSEDPEMTKKDVKLLNSLIERGHTSPFEAVTFTFAVKAPIFVFRQWHRHRTWSFNEVSARYCVLSDVFYLPEAQQVGKQLKHEKQMRDTAEINPEVVLILDEMQLTYRRAYSAYKELIKTGCPRELARCVLPVGIYSEMYATVNLHNLVKFLNLRIDEHAQYEIQVYAWAMFDLIKSVVPHSAEAFRLKYFANEKQMEWNNGG